jgi:hypothetical protein
LSACSCIIAKMLWSTAVGNRPSGATGGGVKRAGLLDREDGEAREGTADEAEE